MIIIILKLLEDVARLKNVVCGCSVACETFGCPILHEGIVGVA